MRLQVVPGVWSHPLQGLVLWVLQKVDRLQQAAQALFHQSVYPRPVHFRQVYLLLACPRPVHWRLAPLLKALGTAEPRELSHSVATCRRLE